MQLVLFLAVAVPFSIFCWLANNIFNFYKTEAEPVSPVRFLIAIWAPLLVAQWGLTRRSLDRTGALAGILIGFIMTLTNLCFFSSLLTFFVLGSKVTKYKAKEKKRFEDNFKEGGQRNWVQVFCNGGIATEFCILYLMEAGCRESLIDFTHQYTSTWFSLGVFGALCFACGDTFSSEIGAGFGKSEYVRLITNFRKVPRGTNGGVTFVGTLASIIGGLCIGFAYYVTVLLTCNEYYLAESPPQWLLIPVGGALGLLGSTLDSLLGATLQYSGYDREKKCIVEAPGPEVEHICGSNSLDNHGVNLLSSFLTAFLAPRVAYYVWHM